MLVYFFFRKNEQMQSNMLVSFKETRQFFTPRESVDGSPLIPGPQKSDRFVPFVRLFVVRSQFVSYFETRGDKTASTLTISWYQLAQGKKKIWVKRTTKCCQVSRVLN